MVMLIEELSGVFDSSLVPVTLLEYPKRLKGIRTLYSLVGDTRLQVYNPAGKTFLLPTSTAKRTARPHSDHPKSISKSLT